MELKVICNCGQKFKFDVEPVDGQMPFTVNCPVCNNDATNLANAILAEKLAVNPAVPAPVIEAPPSPIAPVSGRLRLSIAHGGSPMPAQPPSGSAPDNAPPPIGAVRPFVVETAANPPKKTSFGMGLLGGFIGAMAGSIIYLLIFKFTGLHLKLLAVGVGALAGWFAEFLGKGDGSKELGGITAVFVIAGIVGAQYFVALGWWHKADQARLSEAQSAYASAVVEAGEAVKMIPTGSDAEIRAFLVKQSDGAGIKLQPADFAAEDVKEFRETQLPEYQGLASGRITKEEYDSTQGIKTVEPPAEADSDENGFKGVFLLLLFSRANLFSLAAAGALAFKLSTNA